MIKLNSSKLVIIKIIIRYCLCSMVPIPWLSEYHTNNYDNKNIKILLVND